MNDQMLDMMKPQIEKATQVALQIVKKGAITFPLALTMVLDKASIERIEPMFLSHEIDFHTACYLIGSFARFDWAVKQLNARRVHPADFFKDLPELWINSDPDDTKPQYLRLWKRAFLRNKGSIILDGGPLIMGVKRFPVYRGQCRDEPLGISWSLSIEVAVKFARSIAGRARHENGVLVSALAPITAIYAYLTTRGEEEIVGDHELFESIRVTEV